MRFVLSVLFILIIAAVAGYFLSWWSVAVVPFAVAFLMKLRPGSSFGAGFFGIALLWGVWICWRDIPNQHLLSARLAGVFSLQHYIWYIAVTVLAGGLVGGMAAWSGSLIRTAKR